MSTDDTSTLKGLGQTYVKFFSDKLRILYGFDEPKSAVGGCAGTDLYWLMRTSHVQPFQTLHLVKSYQMAMIEVFIPVSYSWGCLSDVPQSTIIES